MEESFMRERFI